MRLPKTTPYLEYGFPNLADDGYFIKDSATLQYNCAYLADRGNLRWLRPAKSTDGLIRYFEWKGWRRCDNGEPLEGFFKLVIYEQYFGVWSHVSVQQKNGKWLSKLGKGLLIEHNSVAALEGFTELAYGTAKFYLIRKRRYDDP